VTSPTQKPAASEAANGPDIVLARLLPLMPAMGITRLANLTGLDILGIPVAAAVRPNSRSLAVHQGKGLTLAAAKVSAVMEAAEAHHAEFIDAPLRWGRRRDLPVPTVDPARLPRMPGDGDPEEDRCLWIEGRDLMTDAPCWVPHELVHADYTAPQPAGSGLFQATTNGLAAGATPQAAMAHGLCEAIERDAMALWYDAGAALGAAARALDLASVRDRICAELLRRIEATGAAIAAWDVTSDIGLPTFVCIIVAPDDDPHGVETELGAACHADPATALLKALLEAAQTRITRISGARDDFGTESYDRPARERWMSEGQAWLAAARGPRRTAMPAAAPAPASASHALDAILDRLRRSGFEQAIWVDLTKPGIGIPVGRAIVPGLEGPWTTDGDYAPGDRAHQGAEP